MQQYLQGIDSPANKQEVASGAASNGARKTSWARFRNAATKRFNSLEEVVQRVQGS
jgi:hypothetical protein